MYKIPDIFKDSALQQEFDENGFVKINLLDAAVIEKLTSLFHQIHTNLESNTFNSSTFFKTKKRKLEIRDALYSIFLPYFETIFCNYTYIGSSYLYKTKGQNSAVQPHQDWTIVDEHKYVAINIWTPLIDTNEQNGTLYVLPGSQAQKQFTLRAPTIPFPYQNRMNKVIKDCIPTNAKAGEAVILNQSLIHYSSPNLADDIRIAITSGIKSKDAPMIFHYQNEHKHIERYAVPEDFLSDFDDFSKDIYERPKHGKLIEVIKQSNFIDKIFKKLNICFK